MAADSKHNAERPIICRRMQLGNLDVLIPARYAGPSVSTGVYRTDCSEGRLADSSFEGQFGGEKRGSSLAEPLPPGFGENSFPSSLSTRRSEKSTPTSRRLFPRGDELFLSVQTAQSRNYHPPYSNAIECKSAVQVALKQGTRPATKHFLVDTLSSDKLTMASVPVLHWRQIASNSRVATASDFAVTTCRSLPQSSD